MELFSKELKNEFETAVINEPSVFEPLKVYCICLIYPTERDIYSRKDTNIVYNASMIVVNFAFLLLQKTRLSLT